MKVCKLAYTLILVLNVLASVVTAQDKTLRIAFSVPGFNTSIFRVMESGILSTAKDLGNIEIISLDGQDDAVTQLSAVRDAMSEGIEGVVIVSPMARDLGSLLEDLAKAEIPVILVDSSIDTDMILSHISADDYAGGEQAANFIAERLDGRGSVIELLGTPEMPEGIERSKGFNDALKAYPDIEVIARQSANFNAADGLMVTEEILSALGSTPETPSFDAIFAANDDMILGAIETLYYWELDPAKFTLVGFGASRSALGAIKEGSLSATIDPYPNRQASLALRQLTAFIREGVVPEKESLLTPVAIDKDNLGAASLVIGQ